MALDVILTPKKAFERIQSDPPSLMTVLVTRAAWLGLIPPVCAYVGTSAFGWHLGIGEPLHVSPALTAVICALYYVFLLVGFMCAVLMMRWMAPTYGAREDLGSHAAVIAVAGTPLMVGGVAHLYPQVGFNLMLLVPAMIWSTYLLYTGLPVALKTEAERGMLMATSMLGVFFVAANALMIATMFLWTLGIGPDIGFNWQTSVGSWLGG